MSKRWGLVFLEITLVVIFCREYLAFAEEGTFQQQYRTVDIEPGETVVENFEVFSADNSVTWYITWESLDIKLIGPDGSTYPWKRERDPIEGFDYVFVFKISNPPVGKWQMILRSKVKKPIYASIWMVRYSDINLGPAWNPAARVSEPIIKAQLSLGASPILGAKVTAEISSKTGRSSILLHDDGIYPDAQNNDGIYAGSFSGSDGHYVVDLKASGSDSSGQPFQVYEVAWLNFGPPSLLKFLSIEPEIPKDTDGDGLYESLIIPIKVDVLRDGTFKVEAFLCYKYGCREKSTTTIKLGVGSHEIPLEFSMAKFAKSLSGPYTINSLHIYQLTAQNSYDEVYGPGEPTGETGYLTRKYPSSQFE